MPSHCRVIARWFTAQGSSQRHISRNVLILQDAAIIVFFFFIILDPKLFNQPVAKQTDKIRSNRNRQYNVEQPELLSQLSMCQRNNT